jgi:hypothetical protein
MTKKPLPKKDLSHVFKITQSLRNAVMLVWATIVAYIVYVEFVRDIVTIL